MPSWCPTDSVQASCAMMVTILVQTTVNTNNNTLAKNIAATNTNTAVEMYCQYFCDNTFHCLLHSATFTLPRSSINKVNSIIVVEIMATSLELTMTWCYWVSTVAVSTVFRCKTTVTTGRWAFSVAGPSVWNSLPDYLHDPAVGWVTFRQHLKTFMFASY